MPFTTALDVHMGISVLLVVFQAVAQVTSVARKSDVNSDFDILKFDKNLFRVNVAVVLMVNFLTFFLAKLFQNEKRKFIQDDIKSLANFKEGELSVNPPDVKITGYYRGQALRVTNRQLKKYILKRSKTQRNFWERTCKCCVFFRYEPTA